MLVKEVDNYLNDKNSNLCKLIDSFKKSKCHPCSIKNIKTLITDCYLNLIQ